MMDPGEAVHVWRTSLDMHAAELRRLGGTLSRSEAERAARFRFPRDRNRFIAARGRLREVLSLYVDTTPERLTFQYGAHGKPLLPEGEHGDLRFNLSRSLDTMLLAITRGREIGIDIEHGGPGVGVHELAETALSAPEIQILRGIDREARRDAVLGCWVRKEAYIKADGRGVRLPLDEIDVMTHGTRPAMRGRNTGEWVPSTRWTLETLPVGPGQAGALAVEGQEGSRARPAVRHMNLEPSTASDRALNRVQ